jgi:ATP-binding cassette subfamily B protein RaxB
LGAILFGRGAALGFCQDTGTQESTAGLVTAPPITRIVVAHRAALLARAGRALLMRNGRLEEVTLQKQHAEV